MPRVRAPLLTCMVATVVSACGGAAFSLAQQLGTDGGDADGGLDASADAPADVLGDLPTVPPHCSGAYACIPPWPAEFSGPYELYAGTSPPPSCASAFQGPSIDGHDELDAGAATCGCTCGAPQDAGCAAPVVNFYALGQCTTPACGTATLTAAECTEMSAEKACAASTGVSMSASVPILAAGSCPAMPSMPTPPTEWGENARACASSIAIADSDCEGGAVCAPLAGAPFEPGMCIAQTGELPCPTTGYTTRHVYYGSVDDGRGCSICTCSPATGGSCTGSVDVFAVTDAGCSAGAITYVLPFTCDAVNDPADFRMNITFDNGSCSPSAVSATGTATPSQPTTFCCAP